MSRLFNSLKWRVFLSISVTVVLVSILMAALSLWDLGRAAMEEKRASAILAANLAADSLREALFLNGGPKNWGSWQPVFRATFTRGCCSLTATGP